MFHVTHLFLSYSAAQYTTETKAVIGTALYSRARAKRVDLAPFRCPIPGGTGRHRETQGGGEGGGEGGDGEERDRGGGMEIKGWFLISIYTPITHTG